MHLVRETLVHCASWRQIRKRAARLGGRADGGDVWYVVWEDAILLRAAACEGKPIGQQKISPALLGHHPHLNPQSCTLLSCAFLQPCFALMELALSILLPGATASALHPAYVPNRAWHVRGPLAIHGSKVHSLTCPKRLKGDTSQDDQGGAICSDHANPRWPGSRRTPGRSLTRCTFWFPDDYRLTQVHQRGAICGDHANALAGLIADERQEEADARAHAARQGLGQHPDQALPHACSQVLLVLFWGYRPHNLHGASIPAAPAGGIVAALLLPGMSTLGHLPKAYARCSIKCSRVDFLWWEHMCQD